jgi:RHS repeat-associated protein
MYGAGRVAAWGQQNYYYIYDGLGSIVALVNESGQIIENYAYDEWGVPAGIPSGLNTFGFAGEDYDPVTGLVFLRARYYKPDIGRFVTQDEVVGAQTDPLSWNLYIYARNNPATLTDPSGRFGWLAILAIAFFSGLTAGVTSVATYLVTNIGHWDLAEALFQFGIGFIGGFVGGSVSGVLAGAALKATETAGAITKILVGVASGAAGGMAGGAASRVAFNLFTGRPLGEGLVDSILWGGAMGGLFGGVGAGLSLKVSFFKMRGFSPAFKANQFLGGFGANTWKFIRQQVLSSSSPYYYGRYNNEVIAKTYSPNVPTITLGGL